MPRLSIARSLRLALVGLTLVLAVIAALGVASLYHARQRYEDSVGGSSELATAAATLGTAQVIVHEVRAAARGRTAAHAIRQAQLGFDTAARRALSLAAGDPASLRLVRQEISAATDAAALRAAAAIQNRQLARQDSAQRDARRKSRRALILIIVAGAIAVLGALAFVALLIRAMRAPLDSLVGATKKLAAGDLHQRVEPSGPIELRELGAAFNAMGNDLENAATRIEQERSRLATTITSLGDGLLVTEPGSTTVAQANPRARVLIPELAPGTAVDDPRSPLPALEELGDGEAEIEHRGRALSVTAAALGSDHSAGTVWTVRDITERARLERAKSDFVATASHELRSPLTSIKGFVELLAASPGNLSERQREFVSIILRSTDRLADLVNDLLDVARLEADRVEINRRAVDAGEVIAEVLELMGPRAAAKRQQLRAEVAPAVPAVLADAGRLRQILANLVTNAHLYTPEGGEIVASVAPAGDNVRIAVSDNGIGMTQEQLDRIFDRFYRATEDRTNPGSGLGLSIVKSLVELHDGRIEVTSKPGGGTTFAIMIPAVKQQTGPVIDSFEALRGRDVLVVDDEREIAQLIADQLAPFGVRATIAAGGAEALELLSRERFDAVTLDVKMPELDGVAVLRQIRAIPGLAQIPVVFVSVFSDRADLAGEWIVSKPIDAEELRAVLSSAVRAGRSHALVVARDSLRPSLEASLQGLQIDHTWESSGIGAARACSERRFEVALIDVGLPNPHAVLQALDLRGRRDRRAVILFTDGITPVPHDISRLGLEVVPLAHAARSLRDALEPKAADGEPV